MDRVYLPRLLTAGFDFDFGRVGHVLALAFTVRRERRALMGLDPRLLRDIGLDPLTAAREADRDPWDVPESR